MNPPDEKPMAGAVVEEQIPQEEEIKESYVPKMKPGDVEIPNRVFVKGFPREATADDLFVFFADYGKVLECRIVADRYGYSKGYGFITFDSQSVADKVKEIERIKYNDEIELAIGPARIRKKRFYLLPTPQYQQPQAYYTQDGAVFWATCVPQQQVMQQPQIVSPVQVVHQSPNPPSYPSPQPVTQSYAPVTGQPSYTSPIQQQQYATPVHQSFTTPIPQQNFGTPMGQNYGTPVVYSVVTSEPGNGSSPSTPCMYQSNGPSMSTLVEKVSGMQISQSPISMNDDAIVPSMNQYVDMQPAQQPMSTPEGIVYHNAVNPVVSFVPQTRQIQ